MVSALQQQQQHLFTALQHTSKQNRSMAKLHNFILIVVLAQLLLLPASQVVATANYGGGHGHGHYGGGQYGGGHFIGGHYGDGRYGGDHGYGGGYNGNYKGHGRW